MTTTPPLTEDEIRAMRNAALGADGHEWYDDLYRSFEAECTPKRVISLLDEIERLQAQIDKSHTCVVCSATLCESEVPPHCEDCRLTDEHYDQ